MKTELNESLLESFRQAIITNDIKLFDMLANKNFSFLNKQEKILLLKETIFLAISADFIQHVIDYGKYQINYKDKYKNTLLHYAAAAGNALSLQFLIKKGLDIEAKNIRDASPLCTAAKESEKVDALKILIQAGADKNVRSNFGETLLISAAGLNPEPKITRFLLSQGFNPEDKDDDGYTALLNAARWQSNSDVIKVLIEEAHANVFAKSNKGESMFHLAAMNPSIEIPYYIKDQFMTSERDDFGNTCMETALMHASSADVVNLFLKQQREEQMMLACTNENTEVLAALIQAGYDPNLTNSMGITALMMAAHKNKNLDVVKELLYYGANPDAHDALGRNVVHYAAANNTVDIYDWLSKNLRFQQLAGQEDLLKHKPEYYLKNKDEL